jgi:hypothetical protein
MANCTQAREGAAPSLFGAHGVLLELRIPVEPKLLEDLIEVLASLHFPVNPQLVHEPGVVYVDFPAYANHLPEVRKRLSEAGFDARSIEVCEPMSFQAAAGA